MVPTEIVVQIVRVHDCGICRSALVTSYVVFSPSSITRLNRMSSH